MTAQTPDPDIIFVPNLVGSEKQFSLCREIVWSPRPAKAFSDNQAMQSTHNLLHLYTKINTIAEIVNTGLLLNKKFSVRISEITNHQTLIYAKCQGHIIHSSFDIT